MNRSRILPARAVLRGTGALTLAAATAMLLSGCFVIPLADGRSPFDDPFGSTNRDIDTAIPAVQAALDEVDTVGGAWEYHAWSGSENCEGACQLHVRVDIVPVPDPADFERVEPNPDELFPETELRESFEVPAEVLHDVLVAAVPAAEQHRVNVRVQASWGERIELPGDPPLTIISKGSLASASAVMFGVTAEREMRDDTFAVEYDYNDDVVVSANTRKKTDVLAAMGLD
ncbi:hypothetical protein ACFVTX_01635 [Agromyces sp. NPDC058136]|uniref:hypothetical protein n=1 Tax=Agromyces sp. NPDC058136 TaxID=3346354 RepID=UPI0036D87D9D